MNKIIYKIEKLPDLSLSKYQSLGDNGVDGVLQRHISFLRQWQGLSELGNITINLIYFFKYREEHKLNIYLMFRFKDIEYKKVIDKTMKVSPLSEFFNFIKISSNEDEKLQGISFKYKSIIKKIERKKITEDDQNLSLYTVEGYETNDKARLYDLIKTMESLEEDVAYIVSFKGIKANDIVSNSLRKPISYLRKRMFGHNDSINLHSEKVNNVPRDLAIEDTVKCYEDFFSSITKSPYFKANVYSLSNNKLNSKIILNSAIGEAIEKGNVDMITNDMESDYKLVSEEDIKDVSIILPQSLKYWPTMFSLEEIEPFFRMPTLYDGENCSIKKETSPNLSEMDGIYLGNTPQNKKTYIPLSLLMKHMFVCGVPGSGKTNTMLHLANSLWNNRENKFNQIIDRNIPFLVLEPAKKEYRELALFDIPELIIFSPNANSKFPLELNPFEFPKGLTLSEHINTLRQVFEGAFPIEPPAPFILDQAIEKIYLNKGWDVKDINDGSKQYPLMSELYDEFKKILEDTNYDSEIQGNIQSVLEMRIGSLLRREKKEIFNVEHSILSPEEWLERPVVMELESLGKDTSNFITLLICSLIRETLKVNPTIGIESKDIEIDGTLKKINYKPLRHVIFIEEAHNLIANQNQMDSAETSNPKIAATECIVDMLKEVRALREGIIIADQLPTALAMDVIKNSNIKLVHRLTSSDDRGLIGSSMSATDLQLEQMSTYLPGQALLSYEGLLKPFEIRVYNLEGHGTDTPNDIQLYELMKKKRGQAEIYKRYEMRKWLNLQKKITLGLELEYNHRQALREYDFESLDYNRLENYFDQCFTKYQALILLKQSYINEYDALSHDYIDNESIVKTKKIIDDFCQGYKEDIAILINKYM